MLFAKISPRLSLTYAHINNLLHIPKKKTKKQKQKKMLLYSTPYILIYYYFKPISSHPLRPMNYLQLGFNQLKLLVTAGK